MRQSRSEHRCRAPQFAALGGVLLAPAVICSFLLAAATTVAAQAPSPKPAIIVLLRDPSGAKVADATGWLRMEPAWQLAVLPSHGLEPLRAVSPSSYEQTGNSDARGILRFALPANSTVAAGSGMVTTKAGLGALLPRLHAKRTPLITLQPLAQVTTATGTEPFELIARAMLPDGSRITLPPFSGREVRLPAGDYEVWAASRDGLIWQRLTLQPGQRSELQFTGTVQRIQLDAATFLHPAGLPSLSLQRFAAKVFGGEDHQIALRGAALAAPLVSWLDGIVTPARVVPGPPSREARPWPPAGDLMPRPSIFRLPASAPAATTLLGLLRNDDRTFRIVSYATNDGDELHMPASPNADGWLLLLAHGHAALALPWSTTATGSLLTPPAGQPLQLIASDEGSLPIADLAVSYTPEGQDAAMVVAYTDATGKADLGLVNGPGRLHINDARYANQEVDLELIPAEPLPLRVATGETLTATVTFADGAASSTIVVTLRDPSANLRPSVRSLIATTDHSFSFAGLPSESNLLLSASAQRDGKTWSARRIVNVLDEGVTLILQNEDPVLRPSGR